MTCEFGTTFGFAEYVLRNVTKTFICMALRASASNFHCISVLESISSVVQESMFKPT